MKWITQDCCTFYFFVSWSELYDTEIIAEQLHNIADSMTEKCEFLVSI